MSTHSEGLRLLSHRGVGPSAAGDTRRAGIHRPCGRSRTEVSHSSARMQFETEELLISGVSHLIFLDSICLQVTETVHREIVGKGDYCIYSMFIDFSKSSSMNMIMWILLNFLPSFSASSAKMGLVETKLAIIPGGGMNCSRPS